MKTAVIGLTGGIGSGKTLVSRVFMHLGVPVYCADEQAKKLYDNKDILQALQKIFKEPIIADGKLDKKKLASVVFNDKDSLNRLNAFIHPLVKEDFISWSAKSTYPYVIMESAIIFESGWKDIFNKIISICTPENLVIKRTMDRDNMTRQQVMQRISNQMPQEIKNKQSDYVIINDDVRLVVPQVLDIHKEILQLCGNTN